MVCKGVCSRYKSTFCLNGNRYANGQKRCNVCDIFVKWDGHHCPCCGMTLRTRPKISRYRRKCVVQIEPNMTILS